MRKIELWNVLLTSSTGNTWTGVFLEEPSVTQLEAAIWLEIEQLRAMAEDEHCDEEGGEHLYSQEEQMMVFSDLANHVPEGFCDRSCERHLQVAQVQIGTICVEQTTAYTTEPK
ncbi:MAG: hypothetical protein ACYS7Y_11715 [Planctomycetota bacterium]|jgi:hypothetical protein